MELVEVAMGSRIVPPMTRRWFEVLPPPYNVEKPVILVTVPNDWEVMEGTTPDDKYKVVVAMSSDKTECLGLQVVHADLPKWLDQRDAFAHYDIKMAGYAYVGPLSTLPPNLLLNDMHPWLFCRDQMWRRPLDLKDFLKERSQEKQC